MKQVQIHFQVADSQDWRVMAFHLFDQESDHSVTIRRNTVGNIERVWCALDSEPALWVGKQWDELVDEETWRTVTVARIGCALVIDLELMPHLAEMLDEHYR